MDTFTGRHTPIGTVVDLSDEDFWTMRLVAALKSGYYVAGEGKLKRTVLVEGEDGEQVEEIRHCCLGVLCEILPQEIGHWKKVEEALPTLPSTFESFVLDVVVDDVENLNHYANHGYLPHAMILALPEGMRERAEVSMRLYARLNDYHTNFDIVSTVLQAEGLWSLTEEKFQAYNNLLSLGHNLGRKEALRDVELGVVTININAS